MSLRDDRYVGVPMPLADGLPAEAKPLYDELARLFRGHSGGIDSLMYNWGTICSLLASGAAGVVATVEPLIASVLAALAAFFIAATRVLSFDGRWRWHLQRRARYASIIYRLNRGQLSSELEQRDLIRHLYAELEEERMRDGLLPGSGGSVETPARPATSIAAEA